LDLLFSEADSYKENTGDPVGENGDVDQKLDDVDKVSSLKVGGILELSKEHGQLK